MRTRTRTPIHSGASARHLHGLHKLRRVLLSLVNSGVVVIGVINCIQNASLELILILRFKRDRTRTSSICKTPAAAVRGRGLPLPSGLSIPLCCSSEPPKQTRPCHTKIRHCNVLNRVNSTTTSQIAITMLLPCTCTSVAQGRQSESV